MFSVCNPLKKQMEIRAKKQKITKQGGKHLYCNIE